MSVHPTNNMLNQGLRQALGIHRKTGPISTLHVFDFDGTLVRTPPPTIGKPLYLRETGKQWKGGYWGDLKSITPPVIPSPLPNHFIIQSVFQELRDVVLNSQTSVAVVVTGRIRPLRNAVLRILDEICIEDNNKWLNHDAVFTHPMGRLTTLQWKMNLFQQLVDELNVNHLHVWEDRQEHANVFANDLKQLLNEKGIHTTVHFVPQNMP